MTAIAAVRDGGRVWIGADSAICGESVIARTAEPKIIRLGPALVGVAGCSDYDAAWRAAKPARRLASRRGGDVDAWVRGELLPAVAREAPELADGSSGEDGALVAVAGRLYYVDGLAAFRPLESYSALGVCECALLCALRVARGSPRSRVKAALEAAAAHSDSVRPPFVILHC